MANNLMFLRCKVCNEKFCIAKYYPCDWFRRRKVEQFDSFLEKHTDCCASYNDCINGAQIFELEYDNEEK